MDLSFDRVLALVPRLKQEQLNELIAHCARALKKINDQEQRDREEEQKTKLTQLMEAAFEETRRKQGLDTDEEMDVLYDELAKIPASEWWVEQTSVTGDVLCDHDDCWYENNRDRVEEYKSSYKAIMLEKPVVLCDVCIENVDEEPYDPYDIFHRHFKKRKT